MKRYKKILALFATVLSILCIGNILFQPIGLTTTTYPLPAGSVDPSGSNTSFQLSGLYSNSSYKAYLNGPPKNISTMSAFGVSFIIVETRQNSSNGFTSSTLAVTGAKFAFDNQYGRGSSKYFVDKYLLVGGGNGIVVGFNPLERTSSSPCNLTVSVSVVEESMLGPFHILGQAKTIQLQLEFTTAPSNLG